MRLRSRCRSAAHPLFSTLLLLAPCSTSAFYIPGVAPTTYAPHDKVPLYVNNLTPGLSNDDSQLHSVISFEYYHPGFHFCLPEGGPIAKSESLGSILFGDRIQNSPFELRMKQNETCKFLCEGENNEKSGRFVNERIRQNYNINWIVDGLPAAQLSTDDATGTEFYSPGFGLGRLENDRPKLHNHYDIMIEYHELSPDQMRVVGVLVSPSSRRNSKSLGDGKAECEDRTVALELSDTGTTTFAWTYSVIWVPSSTVFATRWDKYLHVFDPKIHWLSLVNSAVVVLFLSAMVASILLRALRKDIARYNRLDQVNLDDLSGTAAIDDGVQEDSGWKLVHGDVFRTPKHPLLLSVFLGSGAQLFFMTGLTIAGALFGFLSPSYRGSLGTAMVIFYTLLGFVGGCVSARVYKTFGGDSWKQNIAYTPLFIPGIVFGTCFLLNLFLWVQQSSGAVPFGTMLAIVALWFLISVPLSFAGSWVGFKQPAFQAPVRTNQIPRQIPPSATYLRPIPSMLLVGILPFGAIFVELYFIMRSIWFSKVYYMFGFLFVCYGLMVITSAAVTILTVYFLLCSEDYHWHWRAFFTAGASAGYVFLNALFYWFTKVGLGGLSGNVLYLGYSALISFLFFILTGTIGFFSSWAFVHRIYGSIKID